jgi:DNA-binding NarL/FixJ family response regulator
MPPARRTAPRTPAADAPAEIRKVLVAAAERGYPDLTNPEINHLTAQLAALFDTMRRKRQVFAPLHGVIPSRREVEIITGLARGLSREELAAELGLRGTGVAAHIRRSSARFGCTHRAGLVAVAYRAGWLADLPVEPRHYAQLPDRWREVLEGMALGLTDPQIAERLGIAPDTVRTHARRMFRTINARTRAHAVALGFQHGHLLLIEAVR